MDHDILFHWIVHRGLWCRNHRASRNAGWSCHQSYRRRGDRGVTAIAILWTSAVASAIVDNIPFVATMIPLIENMAADFGGSEQLMPLWWSLALGACLGGNGSLIGASANLIVAGFAERSGQPIRFLPFMLMAFPLMLVSIAISSIYVYWRFF